MSRQTYLTPEERRERTHQEMVDSILAIAREMMRADGVAALRFNEIARRLGMQPPSLYTYFASKHAIYDTLFRGGFEMFADAMRSSYREGSPPFEQACSAVEAYMTFAQENQDLYQLMMQRPVPGFVPSQESMQVSLAFLQETYDLMQQLFEESSLEPGMPVEEAADLIIATVTGLTNQHLANDPDLPIGQGRFGKLGEQAVRVFFDAWQPQNE